MKKKLSSRNISEILEQSQKDIERELRLRSKFTEGDRLIATELFNLYKEKISRELVKHIKEPQIEPRKKSNYF